MELSQDVIQWLVGQVIVAAAIWGGVRADISNIHSRLDHIEKAANDAHSRIDNHLERTHSK